MMFMLVPPPPPPRACRAPVAEPQELGRALVEEAMAISERPHIGELCTSCVEKLKVKLR